MSDFSTVEDTLFVPMLGRIYATEHFPNILNDSKALSLKSRLPRDLKGRDTQTQYTLLASAVRSTNMDRYIRDFFRREPDGVVVQLGCGLETTFYRCDNGKNTWFEVDLPAVIAYRRQMLGECERDRYLTADAFGEEWIKAVRTAYPVEPILVTASGLLYYFDTETVMGLLRRLRQYGRIEVLFDTVSGAGMKHMSRYMKQVGHSEAAMYFYVDHAQALADSVGCRLILEEPYYAHTEKKGLKLMTSLSMRVSDRFRMVKMIHLRME